MKTSQALLASASLGIIALGLGAAPAEAAPKRRAAAASGSSAELRALREEVEALKARLDAQASQQQATQAAAQDAQAQAAAANTAATAAQAQVTEVKTNVPDQVKTIVSNQKGKPQWFDSTSISGRMYFNFSNVSQRVNGVRPAGNPAGITNGTGFNIKRFYFGVDHKFSDVFAANLTMDVSNVIGQTANTNFQNVTAPAGGGTVANAALVGKGFYIKKAYLQAKLDPALVIRLGAADTPWVPYVEGLYGYRHIENTLIDRTAFGTSADWGIHLLGDVAGGLISYQFSVVDGAGFRNVKITKSVDFEGRVSASYKGFFAGVGGYSGKRGNDTQGAVITLPAGGGLPIRTTGIRTAQRIDGVVGYKDKLFTVGAEYFHAKNWNNTNTVATDKSDGYSAFANVNFAEKWSVFGRYDRVKPVKRTNDNLKDEYYNVGIQWEPVKIVDLALVYKRERVRNGTIGTSNGTIGGANPAGSLTGGRGTYNEIGLFGQLRF